MEDQYSFPGDEEAFSLGINPKTTRIAVILLATIITAAG
jgi:ABC-type Fe3+-siderophore transport system permease subunit